MRRLARERRVFFVEEPVLTASETATVIRNVEPNVHVVSLRIPAELERQEIAATQRRCVSALVGEMDEMGGGRSSRPMLWFYSPAAWVAARDLEPSLVVYDCVGEAATRRACAPELRAREVELLEHADLVFTAGTSLFEAKRRHNVSTYPLPSAVDADDFDLCAAALPADLAALRGRRVGVFGPIDARIDLDLVEHIAADRPDTHVVLVGPLVDLDPSELPSRPNVHWLGPKPYEELPLYIAGCDVALVPYRLDPETRKTEASAFLPCLAARKPIVATPIDEIVAYAERGLATIVEPSRVVGALDAALLEARDPALVRARKGAVASALARTSWDRTCAAMTHLLDEALAARRIAERRALRVSA
ncbi:MAG: glycosyltransferase family 1 protein [Labilithrix sp.]|nr:glycosyltransferase family 1 protein [Labilithrix sp.]